MSTNRNSKLTDAICASIYYIRFQSRQCATLHRIQTTLKKYHGYSYSHKQEIINEIEGNVKNGLFTLYERNGKECYKLDLTKVNKKELEKVAFKREFKKIKVGRQRQMLKLIRDIFLQHNQNTNLDIDTICSCLKEMDICDGINDEEFAEHLKICLHKAQVRGAIKINGINISLEDESRFLSKSNSKNYSNNTSLNDTSDTVGKKIDKSIFIDNEGNILKNIKTRALVKKDPAPHILLCSICVNSNIDEDLLFCHDCGRSGHPSCLQFSNELTSNVRKLKWQCIECKRCTICIQTGNEDRMLFCDACDRGFHMDCCIPPILEPPDGDWLCSICTREMQKKCKKNFFSKVNSKLVKINENSALRIIYDEEIDKSDIELYEKIQQQFINKEIEEAASLLGSIDLNPSSIVIGKHQVSSWYPSPLLHNKNRKETLYFCEFCLKYFETIYPLQRHMNSCCHLNPPGNEIYHDDANNISMFEVDGNKSLIYCRNLCLLAKLFIDHKTVYLDVELFLFYVLTKNEGGVQRIMGYFSKEKYCHQNYNLSCIATFPQYQRCGYGHFLISFSYLLSRKTEIPGSPEKPLSYLGKLSYESYWRSAIIQYLANNNNQSLTIQDISLTTGMCCEDIINTLSQLNILRITDNNALKLTIDNTLLQKSITSKKINIDDSKLVWTPYAPNSSLNTTYDDTDTMSKLSEAPKNTNNTLESPSLSIIEMSEKKVFNPSNLLPGQPLISSTPVIKKYKNSKAKNMGKGKKRRALFSKTNQAKGFDTENQTTYESDSVFQLPRPKRKLSSSSDDKKLTFTNYKGKLQNYSFRTSKTQLKKINQSCKENLLKVVANKSHSKSSKKKQRTHKDTNLSPLNKKSLIKSISSIDCYFDKTCSLNAKTEQVFVSNNDKIHNTRRSNSLKKFDQLDGIKHRRSSIVENVKCEGDDMATIGCTKLEESMPFNDESTSLLNISRLTGETVDYTCELISNIDEDVARQRDEEDVARQRGVEDVTRQRGVNDVSRRRDVGDGARQCNVKDVARQRDVEDVVRQRDVKDVARQRDVEDVARQRDVEDVAKQRDVEDVARQRDVEDVARQRDVEDVARPRDVKDERSLGKIESRVDTTGSAVVKNKRKRKKKKVPTATLR